jgi:hypothetical protein
VVTYPYIADRPRMRESADELRARIPGWGADLDPADRPSYPREVLDPSATGAHWGFPERQPEHGERERSIEHAFLTPAFGTAQPLRGISGAVRRYAYRRHSEAKAAHWLLLIAGDRIDVAENVLRSFATLRPDNPFTQTGTRAELTHGGRRSRLGRGRSDVRHQALDPLLNAAPWGAAGYAAYRGIRAVRKR